MPRSPLPFRLKLQDAKELQVLLHGGVQQVRVVLRAMALLRLDQGASAAEVARLVPLTEQAIRKVAHRYRRGGLATALYERPRPGAAEVLAPAEKQRIVAMACSAPPAGGGAVDGALDRGGGGEARLVPRVGRETIRMLLQSHDLKPWREKNVVRG